MMWHNNPLQLAAVSLLALSLATPALAQNDTMDEAGEAMERAGEQAGDAMNDAADATADAANDAGDAMTDAAEDTADAPGDAAETTEVEIEQAAEGSAEAEIAEGTPVEGQIFEQSPDAYLASTLINATVMNPAGDEIGDVNDLIMNADTTVSGVVIGVGGFLGVGEKSVAIEMDRIAIEQTEGDTLAFSLDASAEELEAAPPFMSAADRRATTEASSSSIADEESSAVEGNGQTGAMGDSTGGVTN